MMNTQNGAGVSTVEHKTLRTWKDYPNDCWPRLVLIGALLWWLFGLPFRSRAQQRYLFARNPKVARKFASKTAKGAYKRLPERVRRKKRR